MSSSSKQWNDKSLFDCCTERGFSIPSMVTVDEDNDSNGDIGKGDGDDDGDNMMECDEIFDNEYDDRQKTRSMPKNLFDMFQR